MTVTPIDEAEDPPERGPDEIELADVYALLARLPSTATVRARQLAAALGTRVEVGHLSRYLYVARDEGWLEQVGSAGNGAPTYRVALEDDADAGDRPDFEALMEQTEEWGGDRRQQTCPFCGESGIDYRNHFPCPEDSGGDVDADEQGDRLLTDGGAERSGSYQCDIHGEKPTTGPAGGCPECFREAVEHDLSGYRKRGSW